MEHDHPAIPPKHPSILQSLHDILARLSKVMNPIEWMKSIYGAIGTKYPIASYFGVMLVFSLTGCALWWMSSQLYNKDHPGELLKARALQLSGELFSFLAGRERVNPSIHIPHYKGTEDERARQFNEHTTAIL